VKAHLELGYLAERSSPYTARPERDPGIGAIMSGVEIVGFILGGIPLVISGLEHYAEGVSTVKIMFNAPSEFKSLSRRLRVEQKIFKNSVELLLHDCIDDDQLLADLMSDIADSRLWSDPEVDKALRTKLQSSYSVYLDTITSLEATLTAFRDRLKLNDNGKVRELLSLECIYSSVRCTDLTCRVLLPLSANHSRMPTGGSILV
jgi:hypothetical protein